MPEIGDWVWSVQYQQPARVIESTTLWDENFYRIWLAQKDSVIKVGTDQIKALSDTDFISPAFISYIACGARIAATQTEDILLAPIGSTVIPLPHQLKALNKAISRNQIRYLLADEVGLGKTIEAGLIMRELKLRGLVRRILVVAPKGLVNQWVSEMLTHFGETFELLIPGEFANANVNAGFGAGSSKPVNYWQQHDQIVCPLDSVKPLEKRRGWNLEQINAYNQKRFDDLIAAGWDLIVVDESHRLGGSTEQVARYKLGQGLADAAPYLLLLSATPHQGKTDGFHRLISLLDREAFPDIASVTRERVQPYVIRTEKRQAIDANGQPLFRPRRTQLISIAWESRHYPQQHLYDAVTDYVREGYNQALATRQNAIGFLMILMQRLVTSSPNAIKTTLERRLAVLNKPALVAQLTLLSDDDWEDLDGQQQTEVLLNSRVKALKNEKQQVEYLLELATQCLQQGIDAKADALLDWLTRLQREENDPHLKILIFTEFVPTQQMLAQFLGSRGISVAMLNGSMSMQERQSAQEAFARDSRVLISTDAGGEGLNLQFCHVIINYDIPWNPMRLEQRIGRVDRIGQQHTVRALNFVFADTVEYRVREVLEEKLATILEEFGVDKTSDVLDSAQAAHLFDELYTEALQNPDTIDAEIEKALQELRKQARESQSGKSLFSDEAMLDPEQAGRLAVHPLPYWIERITTAYLSYRAGQGDADASAEKLANDIWTLRWPDGELWPQAVFNGETALKTASGCQHVTLENPKVRGLTTHLPEWIAAQPVPQVTLPGLPGSVDGVWSLWRITLQSGDHQETAFLPIFHTVEGKAFTAAAQRIWEILLSNDVVIHGNSGHAEQDIYRMARSHAEQQGQTLFVELKQRHQEQLRQQHEKGDYAFNARRRAIGRIGLPEVRQYRLQRLEQEYKQWQEQLICAGQVLPELTALLIFQIVTD